MGQPAASSIPQQRNVAPFLHWWTGARTSLFWLVAIAFAFRLGYILLDHTYKFKGLDNNFSFGWEMGRIGRAIATGRGFADPFEGQTGPTAWEPPLYPYLIAGVFKLAGECIPTSALLSLTFYSLSSALALASWFLFATE